MSNVSHSLRFDETTQAQQTCYDFVEHNKIVGDKTQYFRRLNQKYRVKYFRQDNFQATLS